MEVGRWPWETDKPMSKDYVSLAIDHGTTNSSIAVMDSNGPRVISVEGDTPLLPSAVYYYADGSLRVGTAARRAMMTTKQDKGEGFTGYKLRIGQNEQYEFAAAGKKMTAPELGAVVIQTLLRAYNREANRDAAACVITIPAKFNQNAVEGTRAAAEMAGLKYYPFVMEPVAAAMRYGLVPSDKRAEWMIFDLGGGTLDVSLVFVRNGRIVVPEGGHAGDNTLGGSKFDRELSAYVLGQLGKRYSLDQFSGDRRRYKTEWGKFLLAVEEAKIELSRRTESVVHLDEPLCHDDNEQDVHVEVPVTKAIYESLIAPDVERAVQICKNLLKQNERTPADIHKIILVGGPSSTPFIREQLEGRLGIPLESSIDPMTTVVEGAAIYADTIELPEVLQKTMVSTAGELSLTMEYERHSDDPVYSAVGMIESADQKGLWVEVERGDGQWKSKQIQVDESGVFPVELVLIEQAEPVLSEFRTTVFDKTGKVMVSVEEPRIWFPYPVADNPLASSLRVGIEDNQTKVLIPQGAKLPATGTETFVTTKALRKGTREDVLHIPVLESVTHHLGTEDPLTNCSLHVGTLKIIGDDARVMQPVPLGSEIEVTLEVDQSRQIKAVAYLPLLDEEFEAIFVGEDFDFEMEKVEERLKGLSYRLEKITALQAIRPLPVIAETLESIERTQLVAGLGKDVDRAGKGDSDAKLRAYKHSVELAGTVNELERLQRRPWIEKSISTLRDVVQGTEEASLDDIEREYARAETEEDLEVCYDSLIELDYYVRGLYWRDLCLDLSVLSGMRVTAEQHRLFNAASEVYDRVRDAGGIETATDDDLSAIQETHRSLVQGYDDLFEQRQKKLDELGGTFPGGPETDVGSK